MTTKSNPDDATFEIPENDPRRNRPDLPDTDEASPNATAPNAAQQGASAIGTTGGNDVEDDVGATGSGGHSLGSGAGTVDLSTTGAFAPDEIAGAGPVEGSRSGATAPRVEMTDVGLVDVNAADMEITGDASVESDRRSD